MLLGFKVILDVSKVVTKPNVNLWATLVQRSGDSGCFPQLPFLPLRQNCIYYMKDLKMLTSTYDHRRMRTGHPVRSGVPFVGSANVSHHEIPKADNEAFQPEVV
jgi:hypothetical protein